jgi:hypothetical protein
MKMKIASLIPVVCLAVLSISAKADPTLTFNSSSGSIGPYNLTLNPGGALSLFCLNDLNEIQAGESWGVTVHDAASYLGSASGSTGFEYEEEAYIYSKYNGSNATDVQEALWKIFDSGENISGDAAAQSMVSAAAGFGYTASFLNNYNIYIYDGGAIHDQDGNSLPQNFIGTDPNPPSITPEPSSLILFGSGLVGLAGVARRKLARA